MSKLWLIQNVLMDRYESFEDLERNLQRYSIEYKKVLPVFWYSTIDMIIEDKHPKSLYPFGTVDFVKYGLESGWDVDWNVYFRYSDLCFLGEDFVNRDLSFFTLDELNIFDKGEVFFIKEDDAFNQTKGKVSTIPSWNRWLQDRIRVNRNIHINNNTEFTVSTPKKIQKEYRTWFVNGEFITSSLYMADGEVKIENTDNIVEIKSFSEEIAKKIIKRFRFNTFVLDIFETEGGLCLGEMNCLQCSGLYEANTDKLFESLCWVKGN